MLPVVNTGVVQCCGSIQIHRYYYSSPVARSTDSSAFLLCASPTTDRGVSMHPMLVAVLP